MPRIKNIAITLLIFVLSFNIYIYAAKAQNTTCTGEFCDLESDSQNYTYQANLEDPKCWYKINFCNIDNNLTVPSSAQQAITLLKQVNYQQQADVQMYKDKYESDRRYLYIIISFVIMVAIWNMYLLSRIRRLKNERLN